MRVIRRQRAPDRIVQRRFQPPLVPLVHGNASLVPHSILNRHGLSMNRSHLPMQKEISRSLSLAASSPSGSERNDSQLAGSRLIRRPLRCKIISWSCQPSPPLPHPIETIGCLSYPDVSASLSEAGAHTRELCLGPVVSPLRESRSTT